MRGSFECSDLWLKYGSEGRGSTLISKNVSDLFIVLSGLPIFSFQKD